MPVTLDAQDAAMLHGEHSGAAAFAMRLLVAFAEAVGAPHLIDITRAHIDGCLYHGQVSLDFVHRLVDGGGRVRVPTTLNVGAFDLIHPELMRMPAPESEAARRLMRAHEALGCEPTFTCAPYQTRFRPAFGEQVAWGESNAIAFANSVIGARTNRYGDFMDLCCAVTGRAPAWGLHLDEPRLGRVLFRLTGLPASAADDALFVAVGLIVGHRSGDDVPVIEGLPASAGEDQLKALGAAAASSGAVGLFHAVGITPEAPTVGAAFGGRAPARVETLTRDDLAEALASLSSVPDGTVLSAVCVGTPHFSMAEWNRLLALLNGVTALRAPIYVNTGRDILAGLESQGRTSGFAALGIRVVTDTCTYLTPILERRDGAFMTNSGKWAHYAPGNLGLRVAFGGLDDCVASAIEGRIVRSGREGR